MNSIQSQTAEFCFILFYFECTEVTLKPATDCESQHTDFNATISNAVMHDNAHGHHNFGLLQTPADVFPPLTPPG